MGEEGEFGIPVMLSLCMEHIRREGINTEGIFRRSPASTELAEVKQKFDQGNMQSPESIHPLTPTRLDSGSKRLQYTYNSLLD